MARIELKFGGFGGQGIILSGFILGKAATAFDNKHAVLTQSYGPEARGGACSAEVIVSDSRIDYPHVKRPSIMSIMSLEAYNEYTPLMKKGVVLIDSDLVPNPKKNSDDIKLYSIPATRIAEEIGKKIIANIVMLGFFQSMTGTVSKGAMINSIKDSIPPGTETINMKAFERGFEYGENYKEKQAKKKANSSTKKKAPLKKKKKGSK